MLLPRLLRCFGLAPALWLLSAPFALFVSWLSLCNACTAGALSLLGRPCSAVAKVHAVVARRSRSRHCPRASPSPPHHHTHTPVPHPQAADLEALVQKVAQQEGKARSQVQVRCRSTATQLQRRSAPSSSKAPAHL
jgi:hypothetical protein